MFIQTAVGVAQKFVQIAFGLLRAGMRDGAVGFETKLQELALPRRVRFKQGQHFELMFGGEQRDDFDQRVHAGRVGQSTGTRLAQDFHERRREIAIGRDQRRNERQGCLNRRQAYPDLLPQGFEPVEQVTGGVVVGLVSKGGQRILRNKSSTGR